MGSDFNWGTKLPGELYERWPKDEAGNPEEPVLLATLANNDLFDEVTVNMLEAYGIPCIKLYPGYGSFGKVILGMSGEGTEIYVPKSLHEDALALCTEGDFDLF